MRYRNEWKYYCTGSQLALIEGRLRCALKPDRFQQNHVYRIRSVYFDDENDQCYYDNIGGIGRRKKYRIRTYNHSAEEIKLEIKHKVNEKCAKESCMISRELSEALLLGNGRYTGDCETVRKLCARILENRMRPTVIVEYERTAYTYPVGNVRITLDRNISASGRTGSFFDDFIPLTPVLPPDTHILEVKFDDMLPGFVGSLVDIPRLTRVTFSKYAVCREHIYEPGREELLWNLES